MTPDCPSPKLYPICTSHTDVAWVVKFQLSKPYHTLTIVTPNAIL